jgi:hypothetical protein
MTYLGVFVDDEDKVYAETLSTEGKLHFSFVEVAEVATLAHKIMSARPLVVALDYRLDEAPGKVQKEQSYKGSALAQHLRDLAIESPKDDFALVLVSAEVKIKSLYRPDKTAHDLFDRVYVKERINQDKTVIRNELTCLCRGYDELKSTGEKYDLVSLMCASEEEAPIVSIQELRVRLSEARAPHLAARALLSLIDRPGPLLDIADVLARLGLDLKTDYAIGDVLAKYNVGYCGVFSEAWPRWWAHRLDAWAYDHFGRRPTGMPAADRAAVLSKRLGANLSPARSTWNGSPDELIAFACACCRRGTEMRRSVAVFDPAAPRYLTRQRICWDCVQSDRYLNHEPPLIIDEVDQELAHAVKFMSREEQNG